MFVISKMCKNFIKIEIFVQISCQKFGKYQFFNLISSVSTKFCILLYHLTSDIKHKPKRHSDWHNKRFKFKLDQFIKTSKIKLFEILSNGLMKYSVIKLFVYQQLLHFEQKHEYCIQFGELWSISGCYKSEKRSNKKNILLRMEFSTDRSCVMSHFII